MLKHAMLKHDSENTAAPEVLTGEQLDVVAGGLYAGPPSEIPGEPESWQPHTIPGTYF